MGQSSAGYLFGLSDLETLHSCIARGVYSTVLSEPTTLKSGVGNWGAPQEGTFADYASMQEGDNVYFFIERKIYGVGRLEKLGNKDCKFCNYPESSKPQRHRYGTKKTVMLLDDPWRKGKTQRWLCTFSPAPSFFCNGVDMDDVLGSNPEAFKMFRAFWKRSFIKIDDIENQALKDVILRNNQEAISKPIVGKTIFNHSCSFHNVMKKKIQAGGYDLDASVLLQSAQDGNKIRHEMAIEAGLISQLSKGEKSAVGVFGRWDYLSHQVIASPFKPIDYMDKMDIFGYSYIYGFKPTKARYLVMELKKGRASSEDVEQLMKYVDWVRDEYCFGDYSMIDAFLVASSYEAGVLEYADVSTVRRYVVGTHPAISKSWSNAKLVSYSYDKATSLLEFVPL